jgi:hypothetical protein
MQIHEITRKAVAEGIGDKMIGGLTNMLYKSAGVANPLDQNELQGPATAANQRQAAAGQMNSTLLAPLAKEMYNRWAQTVQQLLVRSVDKATGAPVTSASQLDRAALEKEMNTFINSLAGFDLATLSTTMDDGSGQAKELDADLKPQLQAAIADTQNPKNGANVWLPLATSIQRAKSIKQFANGAKTGGPAGKYLPITPLSPGKVLVGDQPYNPSNPIHKASVLAAGIDPKTLRP